MSELDKKIQIAYAELELIIQQQCIERPALNEIISQKLCLTQDLQKLSREINKMNEEIANLSRQKEDTKIELIFVKTIAKQKCKIEQEIAERNQKLQELTEQLNAVYSLSKQYEENDKKRSVSKENNNQLKDQDLTRKILEKDQIKILKEKILEKDRKITDLQVQLRMAVFENKKLLTELGNKLMN